MSEPGRDAEDKYRPVWFKLAADDPALLAFFASTHAMDWTCVRKIKTGMETCDLLAFLTTEPSEPVESVHPKAMPVILTEPEEIDTWVTAQWKIAREPRQALPDGALRFAEPPFLTSNSTSQAVTLTGRSFRRNQRPARVLCGKWYG